MIALASSLGLCRRAWAIETTPPATLSSAVTAAAKDLRSLPKEADKTLFRYLSTYAVPEKKRINFGKAQTFWVNSLSREAVIAQPIQVTPDLYRVNIEDYGWESEKLWDAFAKVDPYFHVKLKLKGGKAKTTFSPYLPKEDITYLSLETQSNAPILRADWFLAETSVQEGRKGTGYYDVLGLKSRDDFDRLIGLNRATSKRVKREVRGIVAESTVAVNNRQLERMQGATGAAWRSLDVTKSVGRANAVRNLNGDFKHEFEEIYGFLPNGLFAFHLNNAQGVQANVAPPNVASDGRSITPNRQVEVGKSCIGCHLEGIRPIDDVARRIYTPPLALQSPDYREFKRKQQLYIAQLKRWVVRDQGEYADTLAEVNGLTPQQNADAFSTAREDYADKPLAAEDVARELGVTLNEMVARLKQHAAATGYLDTGIAQLLHGNTAGSVAGLGTGLLPLRMRREHVEENWYLLETIMRGLEP